MRPAPALAGAASELSFRSQRRRRNCVRRGVTYLYAFGEVILTSRKCRMYTYRKLDLSLSVPASWWSTNALKETKALVFSARRPRGNRTPVICA